jgi:glycerol-3-phosphate dehydrogenase (NAD(P)+)
MTFQKFGIIGGGAWGTALSMALTRAGRDVLLWLREVEVVEEIRKTRENKTFLPDVKLDPSIGVTSDLGDLKDCDAFLLVAPVQHTRSLLASFASVGASPRAPVVVCSKGIEQKTLVLPSQMVREFLPQHPVAVLSGPTFAAEVAREQATALTLAIEDQNLGRDLLAAIGSTNFRPYLSNDVVGAETGGAVKNVIAIASGIATGFGLGDNARAALITRGLAEMARLVLALGGRAETLMGLSGLGDLVLTCSGLQSRNMSLGLALGQGKSLQEIMASRVSVAEGVFSSASVAALAEKMGVEMPIVAAVDAILNQGSGVKETIANLLARPFKDERA